MSQLTDSEANSPALSGVDDAPGTVLLEEGQNLGIPETVTWVDANLVTPSVNGPLRHGKDQVVILQPPPSRDPNDPLVSITKHDHHPKAFLADPERLS